MLDVAVLAIHLRQRFEFLIRAILNCYKPVIGIGK